MSKKIPLTMGRVAIVDDADFEWLSQWKWHYSDDGKGNGVAARNGPKVNGKRTRYIKMHHEILGKNPGFLTDHINLDRLDNRRCNLRFATKAQNSMNRRMPATNSSGFKGVRWHTKDKKWAARIKLADGERFLGNFHNPRDAAKAYDEAAKKYFGEFARLNLGAA